MIRANTKHRCSTCGAPVSGAKVKECRKCNSARRARQARQKLQKLDIQNPLYCAVCGKQIPWTYNRVRMKVKTCSPTCTAKYIQAGLRQPKQKMQARLIEYIKSVGRYVSSMQLKTHFKMAQSTYYKLGISVPQLNYRAGTGPKLPSNSKTKEEVRAAYKELIKLNRGISISQACKRLDISTQYFYKLGISVRQLRAQIGIANKLSKTKQQVAQLIVNWLKTQKSYVNAQQICSALHIDYACSIQNNQLDVVILNKLAGHERPSTSYYQDRAAALLTQNGIQYKRQKSFPDCISQNKGRLRYDFFIQSKGVLLQLNGEQHYDPKNIRYSQYGQHRYRIKKQYAKKNNYIFVQLRNAPIKTFQERFALIIKQIKGLPEVTQEVHTTLNCWNIQQDNQQPNSTISRKGSTTMAQASTPKQVEGVLDSVI